MDQVLKQESWRILQDCINQVNNRETVDGNPSICKQRRNWSHKALLSVIRCSAKNVPEVAWSIRCRAYYFKITTFKENVTAPTDLIYICACKCHICLLNSAKMTPISTNLVNIRVDLFLYLVYFSCIVL